jgi:aerobic carbon-monoxide dehydrogenase medium subunit
LTPIVTDLYILGLYETALGPAELVTHVSCRTGPAARRHAYVKFSPRSRYDRPALGVAVACGSTAHGACEDVRIALSNVTERPVRAMEAEQVLEGQRASRATIDAVAATAARAFEPMGDLRGSSEYKRAMVRVFVRRALEQALAAPGT